MIRSTPAEALIDIAYYVKHTPGILRCDTGTSMSYAIAAKFIKLPPAKQFEAIIECHSLNRIVQTIHTYMV